MYRFDCTACHVLKEGKRSSLIWTFLVRLFSRIRPINARKNNNEMCATFIRTSTWISCWPKKIEHLEDFTYVTCLTSFPNCFLFHLFQAKAKPITWLERPKVTRYHENQVKLPLSIFWPFIFLIQRSKEKLNDNLNSESEVFFFFFFQVVLWFRVRCRYYFVFHLQSARTFGNCTAQPSFSYF